MNWAEPVGALRRGHDLIDDIELLASTDDTTDAVGRLERLEHVAAVHRERELARVTVDGVEVMVRFAPASHAAVALFHLTGTASHVQRISAIATERQLRIAVDTHEHGQSMAASEEAIYSAVGLQFIPPELRNGDEEIELAAAGQLPRLVSRGDIRGDLHMHTHWSDGRDSIDDMVSQCVALGYEYLAITDHSTHSAAVRNLSVDDIERQADEIASARERYPQIAILHGAEVDILRDGTLDFPDRVLQRLDIVLASLHDRADHSAEELLGRYEQAMDNPLVSIVTHPMNRPGAERPGYDLDVDRLFELAAMSGTVLEIDGAPSHLDLESSLARRAVHAGVTLSVDSDAHRTAMLERHMGLGLVLARRGWVEPVHVLNTKPLAALMDFVSRKRGGATA